MTGPARLAAGGLIDRDRQITFTFDGRSYAGHVGDTLASALLADGVSLLGRSFKYHRPRGVVSAGVEEPNALVGAGSGGRFEPNTRATDLFIYEGLVAVSQNRWPSLGFDLGAANGLIARFIPAGFYYKTFIGPPWLWKIYEHVIRRAAGLGAAPGAAEVDAYEHRAAFCDVLVVGAGPAGLAAALAASETGARVILAEQDGRLGGGLLRDPAILDGLGAVAWIAAAEAELNARGARILSRTTATGYHDHNQLTLIERRVEPGQTPGPGGLSQRLWRVRAGKVLIAAGASERGLVFSNNDLPGVMLSQAVRTYQNRYGVLPGRRIIVATNNDDAYRTALSLAAAGAEIVAVLDSRPVAGSAIALAARERFPLHMNAHLIAAKGGRRVTGAIAAVGDGTLVFTADLIVVSGGLTPLVHLHMQAGGALDWSSAAGAFLPGTARQGQISVGAAAGLEGLAAALADGARAGREAASSLGLKTFTPFAPPNIEAEFDGSAHALVRFETPAAVNLKTAFMDMQNDVTAADIDLAWREGYRSVEHLKRYTTLGMATDQGKSSNILGLARLAAAEGRPIPDVGLTTFRPPFTPVTLGALAGEATGADMAPLRRTPLFAVHTTHDPAWQPVGYWRRPRAYPRAGEKLASAALREALCVRQCVGLTDISTLGKFEIVGPDAGALLSRICATPLAKLAVGRGRYTFMLREDGMVVDDGTLWRLEDHRYLLTSSTGGADRMATLLSYVRHILDPGLKVGFVSVQERWGAVAVAGPKASSVLSGLGLETPAHMGLAKGMLAGTPVLLLAASYSGERAFEIYAPAFGLAGVWRHLEWAVSAAGGVLYGLDALELLRVEKGHIETGAEIDGRRTPGDLGLQRMLRARGGYVGAPALERPALADPQRLRLIGLEAVSGAAIPEGAILLSKPGGRAKGHVTSAGLRLDGTGAGIALALLEGGAERIGETLIATSPSRGRSVPVRAAVPIFHDAEGARYRD